MLEQKNFTISRTLNAPRQLVWDVWTQEEHMKHWSGPKGVTIPYSKLDFRTGGSYHYCMRNPDGSEMWGRADYIEISPIERVVHVQSFSDAEGHVCPAPFPGKWPLKIHSTVTFTDKGNTTEVLVSWHPHEASQEENEFFDSMHESMNGGWGGTFEKLSEYIATLS